MGRRKSDTSRSLRREITGILKTTSLFSLYRDRKNLGRIFHWADSDQSMLEFYRQFVRRGDFVFDVGANLGNRVKIFLKIGASVVAVEPQKKCVKFLKRAFKGESGLFIEPLALGKEDGRLDIRIATSNTISSMSEEWIHSVRQSGRFNGMSWNKTESVRVTTLDGLIQKYGMPDFMKIDVEGYEPEVLDGLSSYVPALSFEFTPEFIDAAIYCIKLLSDLGNYRFNYAIGETMAFSSEKWLDREEIIRELISVHPDRNGDVYARWEGNG